MEIISKQGFAYCFDPAACERCAGRCCRGESGNIWVSKAEIDRIVAFLGANLIDFLADSVRKVDNRLSLGEKLIEDEAVCMFFDLTKRQCRIYAVRPAQCREYPFWNHFRDCQELLAKECPGVRF